MDMSNTIAYRVVLVGCKKDLPRGPPTTDGLHRRSQTHITLNRYVAYHIMRQPRLCIPLVPIHGFTESRCGTKY